MKIRYNDTGSHLESSRDSVGRTLPLVITLMTLIPAGDANARDADAVLRKQFVYATAPFPECHASTIAETPTGLVTAWFGGTGEGARDVGIWVSRLDGDDGRWTKPEEVADGVQHADLRHPCWNPVLFQQPDGPLLLFYKVGPDPRSWWGMLTTSSDGGETWSWPSRLPEEILGPVRAKPVLLPDGTLLCGSSTEHDGWRVHFERTRDLRRWKRIGPVNDGREFGAIQPALLLHGDGRIQALCRSRQNRITQVWSTDGGLTWSDMTATTLPNPSAGIDAVTLTDGRHLLIYNHTVRGGESPRGRETIQIAASTDGKTWKAALALENERGAEFSYPAMIQTRDGRVHITYTWKRQRIRHVVIDPARLVLRDLRPDDGWPW